MGTSCVMEVTFDSVVWYAEWHSIDEKMRNIRTRIYGTGERFLLETSSLHPGSLGSDLKATMWQVRPKTWCLVR